MLARKKANLSELSSDNDRASRDFIVHTQKKKKNPKFAQLNEDDFAVGRCWW